MAAFEHPDICSTAVKGTYASRPFVCVMHFRKEDGTALTTTNLAAIHTLLSGAAGVNTSLLHFWQSLDAQCVIDTLHSRTISRTFPVEVITNVTLAGSNVAADLMPLPAILVKWSSSFATRRFRGRQYLPGVNDGMVDSSAGGTYAAAQRATLATRLNEFAAAWLADATYNFVIYSRANDADDLPVSPSIAVTGASVMKQFAIQRRRRGPN